MCHVLVIEDEPLIAALMADVAELAGATSVVITATEASAIEAARAFPPNVILSDVDLKHGGTGPRACAAIRDAIGPIPVIFITGSPELCHPCDYAAAILPKPVSIDRVIRIFQQIGP